MNPGIPQDRSLAPAPHRAVEQGILGAGAVLECALGLALVLTPAQTSARLFGEPPQAGDRMIGRLGGVALLVLGVGCWGARSDPGGPARTATLQAITAYNAGAALLFAILGSMGKARGRALWGACVLHGCLVAAFGMARR
jgi:hypothetical protein